MRGHDKKAIIKSQNVLRAKVRKRANRTQHLEELRLDAAGLGITVEELQRRKLEEVEAIRRNPPSASVYTYERSSYWRW